MSAGNFGFGYPQSPGSFESGNPAPLGGGMSQGSFLPMNGMNGNAGVDDAMTDSVPAATAAPGGTQEGSNTPSLFYSSSSSSLLHSPESFVSDTMPTSSLPQGSPESGSVPQDNSQGVGILDPERYPNLSCPPHFQPAAPSPAPLPTMQGTVQAPKSGSVPENNPQGIFILNPDRYPNLPGPPQSQPVASSAVPCVVSQPTMEGTVQAAEPSGLPGDEAASTSNTKGKAALKYVTLPPYDQNVYVCETCGIQMGENSAAHKNHVVFWICPFCGEKKAPGTRSSHLIIHQKNDPQYAPYIENLKEKSKDKGK